MEAESGQIFQLYASGPYNPDVANDFVPIGPSANPAKVFEGFLKTLDPKQFKPEASTVSLRPALAYDVEKERSIKDPVALSILMAHSHQQWLRGYYVAADDKEAVEQACKIAALALLIKSRDFDKKALEKTVKKEHANWIPNVIWKKQGTSSWCSAVAEHYTSFSKNPDKIVILLYLQALRRFDHYGATFIRATTEMFNAKQKKNVPTMVTIAVANSGFYQIPIDGGAVERVLPFSSVTCSAGGNQKLVRVTLDVFDEANPNMLAKEKVEYTFRGAMIAWIAEVAQANINLLESKANRIQKEIEAEMDLILQQEAEAQAEEDRREAEVKARVEAELAEQKEAMEKERQRQMAARTAMLEQIRKEEMEKRRIAEEAEAVRRAEEEAAEEARIAMEIAKHEEALQLKLENQQRKDEAENAMKAMLDARVKRAAEEEKRREEEAAKRAEEEKKRIEEAEEAARKEMEAAEAERQAKMKEEEDRIRAEEAEKTKAKAEAAAATSGNDKKADLLAKRRARIAELRNNLASVKAKYRQTKEDSDKKIEEADRAVAETRAQMEDDAKALKEVENIKSPVKEEPKVEEVKEEPKVEEVKEEPKVEEVKEEPKVEEVKDEKTEEKEEGNIEEKEEEKTEEKEEKTEEKVEEKEEEKTKEKVEEKEVAEEVAPSE
eukprot:TRINITY_DN145_c0_g6_i1.p1 TRINITY_DN145_c0_g6~~TRINITY_DN145_c0_g6_i1.p1  ORF type:complete len:704 (+),score=382.13 TRINITY_DN145_c0_g6_i1:118-2112(+)